MLLVFPSVMSARLTTRLLAGVLAAGMLTACTPAGPTGGGGSTVGGSPAGGSPSFGSAAARPSSAATVHIDRPTAGQIVTGPAVHVVIALDGARIVPATSTNLSPTEGHLHLYVDNVLVSMNYGLEQDVPVRAGTYVLKAEFVAADHAPFNPRVWSPEVVFTVK
jgi:hypothetical protein